MSLLTIDDARCIRCGLCAQDCIPRVIAQSGKEIPATVPEREGYCMKCQHCLAVCPTGALSNLGKQPEDSLPLADGCFPTLDQMDLFVRGRRSVRKYQDENVDPALLRRLLAALGNVPTGANRCLLTYAVIDDKEVMGRLRARVMGALAEAAAADRFDEQHAYLARIVDAYVNHGVDGIFRTAPHALIVSCAPEAATPAEDVALALAYFELLAQSAGLGTVWWGLLRRVLNFLPELQPELGIPEGHAYYAILFGVPAIKYARTVQRDDVMTVQTVRL